MYKYEEIKMIHLETTSKCNAACPMCLRNQQGGALNQQLPITEISLDDAKAIFEPSFVRQLKRLFMCGNYGDPMMAKDCLEIFEYLREQNEKINLSLITNGSARPTSWWTDLAKVTNSATFSIDGLADTNHLYRRNTRFESIIKNMTAYIQAGGHVRWDFIVFRHNEHQIQEAKDLAKSLGVQDFQVKKTGRFFSNTKSQVKPVQPVYKVDGSLDYELEMPVDKAYHNKALQKEEALISKYGSLEAYLDRTPVSCKVAKEKSLYISAEGLAFPCCWTGNQLYPWYFKPQGSPIWNYINALPEQKDSLSAIKHPLKDIVDGPFFQKTLPDSWNLKSIKSGKLKCCAKTCGTEFDPFKEQFA